MAKNPSRRELSDPVAEQAVRNVSKDLPAESMRARARLRLDDNKASAKRADRVKAARAKRSETAEGA